MAATLDILLELKNIGSATNEIKNFAKTAEKSITGISNAFSILKVAAVTAIAAMGFKETIKAAEESDKAIQGLTTSLKLAGDFSDEAVKSFEKLGSQLEVTANIEDEQVLKLASLGKSLGLTNSETEKVIRASADLAAATGTDLNSAFEQLNKTMNGQVGVLGRQFPELKALSKEQLIAGEGVKLLGERFAGAAAAINNTFSGASTQVGIQFKNIFEELGKIVTQNPLIIQGMQNLAKAFQEIQKTIEANRDVIIELVNGGFRLLISTFPLVIKGFAFIDETITNMYIGVKNLQRVFTGFSQAFGSATGDAQKNLYRTIKLNTEALDAEKSLDKRKKLYEQIGGTTDRYIASLDVVQKKEMQIATASIKASEMKKKALQEQIDLERTQTDLERTQIALQQKQIVQQASQGGLGGFGNIDSQLVKLQKEGASQSEIDDTRKNAGIGAAVGVGAEVFKGQAGAANLFAQAAGLFADSVIPGIGGIISQITNVLAQGPEAAAGFIRGFLEGIPIIIENILLSIHAVIDAVVEGLLTLPDKLIPRLGDALSEVGPKLAAQAPFIAQKFALALAVEAPFIGLKIATGFIQNIPAIVKGFVDEIKKQFTSLGGILGGGGGGGGILGGVKKIFGFADGGIPRFSGGDNVLAGFNADELVVDKTTTQKLGQFLDQQMARNSSQPSPAAPKASPQATRTQVVVPIMLDRKQLAQAIFELTNDGYRVIA